MKSRGRREFLRGTAGVLAAEALGPLESWAQARSGQAGSAQGESARRERAPGASYEMSYDPRLFGARGNGVTKDTQAIQRAIDACARAGGGRVRLVAGRTFLSGTVVLKPHVDLHLEPGAVLRASGDRDDFRKLGALIVAERADGVSVSGPGTIDGNFHAFLTVRDPGGYRVTQPFLGPYDPLYDKPGKDHPDGRPRMILLVGCGGAALREFTIRDSPTWTIHPIGCENLLIAGITIRNDLAVPNCDGIDIDHCRNVRVADCDITAGDDCVVVKASRNFGEFGTCENVTITNCVLRSSSAAFKMEPEGPDPVRMVVMSDCTIAQSNRGICMLNRDGARVEDFIFSNLVITTQLQPAMWWGAGEPVHISNLPRKQGDVPGVMRGIQFNNLVCRAESGMYLHGWAGYPVDDVTFNNVDLTLEKTSAIAGGFYDLRPGDVAGGVYQHSIAGVYCEQARDVRLRDFRVRWEGKLPPYYGAALEAHHVEGLSLRGFAGQAAQAGAVPGSDATPDRILEDCAFGSED